MAEAESLPTVSVVIPCYRQAHFLSTSVGSAIDQTGVRVEVIVVDDGSPDDVPGALAAFPQVRLVRQANSGLPAARNAGLRAATGEFVVFLDSDDYLYPGALAAGVAALASDPDAAFAAGGYHDVYADGREVYRDFSREAASGDQYANLVQFNAIGCPAAAMYRRSVFAEVGGFDPTLRSCEDWDLVLRIARTHRFVAHPGPVVGYRHHPEGMSRNSGRMLTTALEVLRRQRAVIGDDRARRRALKRGIALACDMYQEPLVAAFRDAWRPGGAGWRAGVRAAKELLRSGRAHAVRRLAAMATVGVTRRLRAARP